MSERIEFKIRECSEFVSKGFFDAKSDESRALKSNYDNIQTMKIKPMRKQAQSWTQKYLSMKIKIIDKSFAR